MSGERFSEQPKLPTISIDEYLAGGLSSDADFSGIHGWCAPGNALQGSGRSIERLGPAAIMEFDASARDCDTEAHAHALMQRVQALYEAVYLIDRTDGKLVEIESYAQLCCLMLAGDPTADLLCVENPADAGAVAEFVKRPAYNANRACTWRNTDAGLVSFFGLYPDGWNHADALGVVSGIPHPVSIRARVCWHPRPDLDIVNHIRVSVGDSRKEITLRDDVANDLEIDLPENGFAYLWGSATREASEIWSNADPRLLSFCLSEIEVVVDR